MEHFNHHYRPKRERREALLDEPRVVEKRKFPPLSIQVAELIAAGQLYEQLQQQKWGDYTGLQKVPDDDPGSPVYGLQDPVDGMNAYQSVVEARERAKAKRRAEESGAVRKVAAEEASRDEETGDSSADAE